jgi:hypothetical protein
LQALLASVGGGEDKSTERESEREEWEKRKRAAAQREAELCSRLAEQNRIAGFVVVVVVVVVAAACCLLLVALPLPLIYNFIHLLN